MREKKTDTWDRAERMNQSMLPDFLDQPVEVVALLGYSVVLEREVDSQTVRVKIVEVEAYDETDPASHAYGGIRQPATRRCLVRAGICMCTLRMALHSCCNIVTGQQGKGSGVLIRARLGRLITLIYWRQSAVCRVPL